jgi:hypothetical protein
MDVNTLVAHLCKQVSGYRRGSGAYDIGGEEAHRLTHCKGLKPCCAALAQWATLRPLHPRGPCGATGTAAPRLPWKIRCQAAAYFVSLTRAPGGGSGDHKMDGLTQLGIRLRPSCGAALRAGLLRKRAGVRSDCRSPFSRGGAAASATILIAHRGDRVRWKQSNWFCSTRALSAFAGGRPLPRGRTF